MNENGVEEYPEEFLNADVMRPAYRDVKIKSTRDGYTVLLECQPIRTPANGLLKVPFHIMAEALADEWRGQEENIIADQMPLTRLAMISIDRTNAAIEEAVSTLASYAETDLLCYRADGPLELVVSQSGIWDPLVHWAESHFSVNFSVTTGVVPIDQNVGTRKTLELEIMKLDTLKLTAVQELTQITGSLIIALALAEGEINGDEAWRACQVDEDFRAQSWGKDPDEVLRAEEVRLSLSSAVTFLQLCRV